MKQQRPIAITGGTLVTSSGLVAGTLRLVDGAIAAVGGAVEVGDEVIEAKGQLVAPGLVDFGVFAIDKPAFHFGGITRAGLMPDQSPPLDHPSRVRFAAQSGKPDFWVHPLAGATAGLEGTEWSRPWRLIAALRWPLPGVIALGAASYTVAENGGSIVIPVTRSGGSTGAASVTYATANSSAVAGSDFAATSGTLTWANGDAATKNIRITVYNDTLAESSEGFQLRLGVAAGASLGSPATAAVTITDDDTVSSAGSIAFASSGLSVLENTGTASISVSRSAGTIGAVSVDYTITGGTATAGSDYSSVSGTLSWADTVGGSKIITLPLLNDALAEASETVVLTLSNATGGAVLGAAKTSTLTITDDDGSPGALSLSAASYSVGEAGGAAIITVTRTGGSYGAAAIDYTAANGLAQAGSDYNATAGKLVWNNGDAATKSFSIPIYNDLLKEGAETILLRLSNPQGAVLGSIASGTATIVDND